ncbi:Ig-like domain-containing protein [Shewanella aestuarii]|uniref:SRCR domain-containing protein n=1 Tax=Shewanella aestuarii TaxID=1028752 RepID=A0A6G9QPA6_9GAMM|nr:Ig-like domain-containing protein [Shewanella aestuarii]QIR16322.1 hypothetical protein HBH39_17705 [Shewanella aestuarii]
MNRLLTFCCLMLLMLSGGSLASTNTLLPDIKALALDKLVLDRTGQPITVFETPPIMNSKGEVAKGMTEIILSLDSTAKNSLIVQGKTLSPGGTLNVVIDLTATNGVIKIPAYPAKSGISGLDEYKIDIPKVTAQLCSDEYTYDQANNVCLKVETTNLIYTCPNQSWKATGDLRNCTQETTIAKENCPTGYVSNGNGTCTKTEYQATLPKCESGYSYSTTNKRCEKTLTESAYKTCSDPTYSYNSATNDCRKTITQSVNYDCPTGYNYNSTLKKCERTLTATASKVCSTGYTYSATNNRCEKPTSIDATPVCTSGYTYNGTTKRCEQTLTESANKVCSAGFTYSAGNNRCEKTTTANASIVCPSTYSYNSTTKRCEKTLTESANKVCSTGYTFSSTNNRCEKTTTVNATPVCTSGYTYNGTTKRCEQTLTESANKVCSAGFTYSAGNNRCEKTTTANASIVCPSTYSYNSTTKRCEKTLTESANKVCSAGFTYSSANNRCEKTTTANATPVCSSGYSYNSTAKRCEKTLTESANKVCSAGFTYSSANNRCEKTTTTNASIVCPSTYSYNSTTKLCEKLDTLSAGKVCAIGYTYSATNDRCEKTTTTNATPVCSSGYTYNSTASRCEKTLTETANKVCSAGFTYSSTNNRCEKITNTTPSKTCPSGYTFSATNNRCEKTETVAANPTCQAGYSYSTTNKRCEKTETVSASKVCGAGYAYVSANDRCEKTTTITANIVCATGYTYSSTNKRCEKTETVSASKVCASGYTYSSANNRCEKTTTIAATKVCASGYTYSSANNRCEKTTTVAASKVCATGYTYSSANNRCEKTTTVAASKVCATGYTFKNDRCEKTTTVDASKVCASGYTYNATYSRCEKTITVSASKVCASGYSYSETNDRCEKATTVVATKSCPTGYSDISGQCTKVTSVARPSVCPSGYTYFNSTTCQKTSWVFDADYDPGYGIMVFNPEDNYYWIAEPNGGSRYTSAIYCFSTPAQTSSTSTGNCRALGYYDLDIEMTYNSKTQNGFVKKTDLKSKVDGSCASGYTLNTSTNQCDKTEVTSYLYSCSAGFTLSGTVCNKFETQAFSYQCNTGYTLSGSTCSKLETANFSYSCSTGYTLSGSSCSKLETQAFTYSCSAGYTLSGSSCSKLETQAFTYSCGTGYTLSGSSCSKLETQAFSYSCGTGYTLSGSSCSKLETQAFSYSCGTGYTLSGSSCSRLLTQPNTYSCSAGYTLSGSSCSKLETQAFTYSCGTGYTLSGSTCSKLLTQANTYSCDSGYTLSGSSCSRLVTQSYSNVCSAGYTLSGSTCTKLETQAFSYQCNTGYTLSGSTCSKLVTQSNTWSCSAGFTLSGSTCSKFETDSYTYGCPPTYTTNGSTCSKLLTEPNTYSCSAGYTLSGSTCTKFETQAFSYQCNTGYTLSGSTCSKLVTQSNTWSCSTGFTLSGSTCTKFETQAFVYQCGDASYTLSGSTCSKLLTEPNTYSCSAGYTLSGSTCTKFETQAFSYQCNTGYTLSGSTCSKLVTQANTWSCSTGFTLSGSTCTKFETQAFVYQCGDASYTLSGSTCSKLLTEPNTYSCSAGYTLSGSTCTKFETQAFSYQCGDASYTLSGSMCSKLIFVSNTWSCPANTNLSGDKCLGTDIKAFTYSCPANYTNHNNGSCSLYQSQGYTLSCPDSTYTPNQSTEICEKVLKAAHIYKCNDPKYTLNGSSCSLLLTATEEWICGDLTYNKISETQCRRLTDADLTGKCPANYVRNDNICTLTSKVPQLESCSETYKRNGAECERDVFKAASCADGLLTPSSCICPTGTTLNENTYMCEGVEKSAVIKSCPSSYDLVNGQCEYQHQVGVVYDYCATGMTSSGSNCLLSVSIPATQSCNSPYANISGKCQYTDTLPAGVGGGDVEAKSFEGKFISETSAATLENLAFDAVVSDVNEIAVDVAGGCRLVTTEMLAKGPIKKGDVPCALIWKDLPDGLSGKDNKITGIFNAAGQQKIGYQLKSFNGSSGTPFIVSEGEIVVEVSMPEKPEITDITTRMMNKVVRGFDVYNYDAASKINLTTVLVDPKVYEQVVEIEGLGSCTVPANASSCNIYSDQSFERDENNLQFTSSFKVWGNSKIGGWDKADLTPKNWNIKHDFRGPKIAFTEFNDKKANPPIVNEELGFPVIVNGGEGAIGIVNFRDEVALEDRWWRPTKVDLEFISDDGKKSVNMINVNGMDVLFDVPQSKDGAITLSNYKVLEHVDANGYPFMMTTLTPGVYNVKVTAKDAFNNTSVTNIQQIKVDTPAPQIKVFNKKAMLSGNNTPSVVMIDDLMVVAHNGFEGDTKITSVKIDGREARSINNDEHFKLLTGDGFDLIASQPYELVVEAQDSDGVTTQSTIHFNYLQMEFNFQRKPQTVIQLVEDVGLVVSRTKGLRCDIYGTKAAAALAANDMNHACYIEWSQLPQGMSAESNSFQATAKGGVSDLGMNTAEFTAYIVNKEGKASVVSKDAVTFESIAPSPITLTLDDRLKLADGIYSISVLDRQIGRYQGTSSRANVDIDLSTDAGDSKQYKHNQLPFGETQNFSAYADKLGEANLWDRVPYTLKGSYRLAPEKSTTINFDLVVTPHPYMQVLMELDDTRYASTEKINATISLGVKNNLTNTFDYNIETMGTAWDVYLAFKNGTDYEPISEAIQIGSDGKGVLQIDADIIFNRNEAVYAVAEARSPFPEIEIVRVSIPRSISVVKGTAVDGEIVSRVVHSRIPAAFDLRFDTQSFQDFMVMGEIKWQRDIGGVWTDMTELTGRQYVSVKSVEPETIDVRAVITNKVTGAITETEKLRLISFDTPKLRVDGVTQAIAGQSIELTAVDISGGDQSGGLIVEWSTDGEIWEKGDETYIVNVEESSLRIHARMKYANTADDINQGQWSTAVKYISVTKPKPMTMSVVRPSMAEVNTEISLKMMVSNPFESTGIALLTEWLLPDGSIINDEKEITYTLQESDLDDANRVTFIAKAWLDGFKDVTLGEANAVMNTFSYSFPKESELSLTVNNNVKFVPSSGFANVNMPYINAPGVVFAYDWTFDEAAIQKVSANGKGLNFNVIKPGIHEIMVTVSDNRGNFAHITDYVEAVEPNELEFVLNDVYSNKYMRAPLTVSIYPNVKVGHPYDFVKEYSWTINGVKGDVSGRAVGAFNDLPEGHYDIILDVKTNYGQVGQETFSFDVVANKNPVCAPTSRNQYGTHIVDANCKDEDGRILFYKWIVNGMVFSPYGAQVRFTEHDYPNGASIVIEANDDAGGIGVGHISF